MPRHQEPITVEKDIWTELTSSDVTSISFQVLDGEVEVRRSDATGPETDDRGWIYPGGTGERQVELSAISSGTGSRLWAKGRRGNGSDVMVDHA